MESNRLFASVLFEREAGTMVVTALMAFVVIWKGWGWRLWAAAALMGSLAAIDLMFLAANFFKVFEGGWVTLTVAGALLLVMLTWKRGVKIVSDAIRKEDLPLDDLIRGLEAKHPTTVRGTAIYLTRHPDHAPAALLHSLKHFKVMHERIAVLVVHTARVPRVPAEAAVKLTQLSPHFWSIEVRLHGNAQYSEGIASLQYARMAVRIHGHVLCPVASLDQTGREYRHAALAGSPLHHALQKRRRCYRIFLDPPRAGRRAGCASERLTI